MADEREPRGEHAHGVLRPRRAARRRGDHDPRAVSVARVTVFYAPGCTLCAQALEVVEGVREEVGFELELVDVSGNAELDARYRERLPVVEVDGAPAFDYFVDAEALRRRLAA